jgi:hypothetical protein
MLSTVVINGKYLFLPETRQSCLNCLKSGHQSAECELLLHVSASPVLVLTTLVSRSEAEARCSSTRIG